MKSSEIIKKHFCAICPDKGTPWCKDGCAVGDLIEDLEEMEDEE